MPPRLSIVATGLLVLVVTITAACQADRAADATRSAASPRWSPSACASSHRPSRCRRAPRVTWRFEDGMIAHNVTGDGFASKNATSGTWTHRFDRPDEFRYRCTVHAGMDGRVVVS
jgi:plastocyanin